MRTQLTHGVLALALLTACGSPPPVREKPAEPAASSSAPPVVVAAPDLAPVPVPSGIVAKARIANLDQTARKLGALSGLPTQALTQGGRGLVAELLGRRGVRLDVDAAAMAQVARPDAPVDFVVALADSSQPEPLMVVSIPLASYEDAKAAAGAAGVERGQGVLGLEGKRGRGSCQIMSSAGVASARLVCGTSERDLEVLAPYVVRNLAAESQSTGDLSAELDVRAIDAKFGKELRAILPSVPTLLARRFGTGLLGRALGDGGRLIGEEAGKLLTDLDTLKLDLNVTDQVSLNVTASFRAETSFVARSSFGQPSGPAPALFWKGPADAASGSYTTLTDPAHYADVITTGKQLVVGLMTEGKIGSDAERKKVAALLDFPLKKGMVFTSFSGTDRLTPAPEPKTVKDKWQRALAEMSGWSMTLTNDTPDALIAWSKSAVAAFNAPGIQKAMKEQLGKEGSFTLKNGKAPAKAPKGSHLIELRMPGIAEKTDVLMFVLIAPAAGGGTSVTSGFDLEDLAERASRANAGQDELAARADLAVLRSEPSQTGFFFSTAATRSMLMGFFAMKPTDVKNPEDHMLEMARRASAMFAGLPHKGKAPMFATVGADRAKKTANLRVAMPKPMLNELAALVKQIAR